MIVGVKAEIGAPLEDAPRCGRIEVNVECGCRMCKVSGHYFDTQVGTCGTRVALKNCCIGASFAPLANNMMRWFPGATFDHRSAEVLPRQTTW